MRSDFGVILAVVMGLALAGSGCQVQVGSNSFEMGRQSSQRKEGKRLELTLPQWDEPVGNGAAVQGSWEARGKWIERIGETGAADEWVHLQFHARLEDGRSFNYAAQGIRASELRMSQAGGKTVEANLSTARLLLHQAKPGARDGVLEVVPDRAFVQRGRELLDGELTVGQLLRFGMRPQPLEYIELVCANSNRWTWSEVLHLYQRGVDSKFVLGLRQPAAEKTTTSAAPATKEAERPARPQFSADDLVLLHSRGVTLAYVEGLEAANTAFTAQELALLHSRGVTVEYVREAVKHGVAPVAGDLALLRSRGVTTGYIGGMREAGYGFDANELVLLFTRGVKVDYARALKEAGGEFSANDLVLLSTRGVRADYVASVSDPRHASLSAGELVRLHQAGVPAETVRKLRR